MVNVFQDVIKEVLFTESCIEQGSMDAELCDFKKNFVIYMIQN